MTVVLTIAQSVTAQPDDGFGIPGWFIMLFIIAGVFGVIGWYAQTRRDLKIGDALDRDEGVRVTALQSSEGPAASRLRELKRLRDDGLITEGEYVTRRAAIIADV